MSALQDIPIIEEWRRLKSLRSYRHRLLNTTGYQQLDRAQLLSYGIGAQNDASLLEDGLRNMMRRNDLDMLLDNGLDVDAQLQAFAALTSLCAALESVVATNLWTESLSDRQSKYPRIDRLLQELGSTEWQFYMASVSRARKLFVTTDFKSIKEQVDSFNTLFSRLTQPEIEGFEVPNAQQAEQEQTSGSHAQPRKAIKDLQALLLWLAKLTSTTCSGSHDVLLQLPEWDPTSSCEHFREPHLDLYLSRCEPSEWQESRLHELADRNHIDWYPAQNLCDEINFLSNRERLTLAAAEGEVYVYGGADSPNLSKGKPSKTLKQLIQSGAFLGPDAWWSMQKFEQTEKRTLAATLVLGFSLTVENAHLIKCWDPESVYFLSDSKGNYINSRPYALCLASVPSESTEPHFVNENEREERFALLARLLMEIECGVSLEHIQIKDSGHLHPSVNTLENLIYDQISIDLNNSRRSYLEAVRMCFRFHQNCRREYKRMSTGGHQGGEAAAARNLIHRIVHKIQMAVNQQLQAKTFDQDLLRPAADYSYWPSVSPQLEQLGMSDGSHALSATTVIPSVPSDGIVQKKLHVVARKQVRFVTEGSDEEKEENTTSGALVDSAAAPTDDCELFGDANTQEYPKDYCQSAKNHGIQEASKEENRRPH